MLAARTQTFAVSPLPDHQLSPPKVESEVKKRPGLMSYKTFQVMSSASRLFHTPPPPRTSLCSHCVSTRTV